MMLEDMVETIKKSFSSNIKRLGFGLLYLGLNGCSEENVIQRPRLEDMPEHKTSNYVFTPADSAFAKNRNKDYKDWSLVGGLDLDGVVIGLNVEGYSSLQEFTFSERTSFLGRNHLPFGPALEGYTAINFYYSDNTIKQLTFAGKTYIKNDFEFIGAHWRYGVGGGLKLSLRSRNVMLVDSSIINELYQVDLYPTLGFFVQADFKQEPNGIKLVFDNDIKYYTTLQIAIMLNLNVESILKGLGINY